MVSGSRGRGRGRRGQRQKDDAGKQWVPVTKLGRLVNDGKIKTVEDIYLFSLPIKVNQTIFVMCRNESSIVNLLGSRHRRSTLTRS